MKKLNFNYEHVTAEDLQEAEDFKKFLVQDETFDRAAFTLYWLFKYGQFDGGHHKAWSIDQAVRQLTGDNYEAFIKEAKGDYSEEEEEFDYEWDEGIAP